MKKSIVFFVAVALSFSLVACTGGSEAIDNPQEKYAKYAELFDMLENGNYDAAVRYINDMYSTSESQTPDNNTPTSVDLTIENWDEYFEFTPYIRTAENSFGEFQCIDRFGDGIGLKEQYVGRVNISSSDIAIEVEFGPVVIYRIQYNIETKELTISNQDDIKYGDDTMWFFGTNSVMATGSKEDCKLSLNEIVNFGNFSSPDGGWTEALGQNGTLNGDFYTFYAPLASDYKIIRVQGTILVSS